MAYNGSVFHSHTCCYSTTCSFLRQIKIAFTYLYDSCCAGFFQFLYLTFVVQSHSVFVVMIQRKKQISAQPYQGDSSIHYDSTNSAHKYKGIGI
jgi:hypothetical protein